jgi:predicted ribosome quality control (RQC) complex YloA/Tae2 family protein
MGSRGRPYRTVVLEGFEVLIGKGDEENDHLTFDVAAPADFWLHVAGGTPGSHVVIRNPEKLDALPPPVVARAAGLAAWFSKARRRRQVDVHLCHVADVRKRRGALPGEVELRRWQRVRVRPLRIDEAGEG